MFQIFGIPVANRPQFTDKPFHLLNCSATWDHPFHAFPFANVGPRFSSLRCIRLEASQCRKVGNLPKYRHGLRVGELSCRRRCGLFRRTMDRAGGPMSSCSVLCGDHRREEDQQLPKRILSLRNRDTLSLFHFRPCCTFLLGGKRGNGERTLAQGKTTAYMGQEFVRNS